MQAKAGQSCNSCSCSQNGIALQAQELQGSEQQSAFVLPFTTSILSTSCSEAKAPSSSAQKQRTVSVCFKKALSASDGGCQRIRFGNEQLLQAGTAPPEGG